MKTGYQRPTMHPAPLPFLYLDSETIVVLIVDAEIHACLFCYKGFEPVWNCRFSSCRHAYHTWCAYSHFSKDPKCLSGLSRRQTDRHVRPSVTSNKVLVCQIRVNAMLTSDKVKLELLCPRWLPRRCHVGWLDVSFHYIARAAEHIALWRARTAAIGARTAGEWGAHR
jgi:hypothetical protein